MSDNLWYQCMQCGEYIFGNKTRCPECGYTVYDIPAIVPWKVKAKRLLPWIIFLTLIVLWLLRGG